MFDAGLKLYIPAYRYQVDQGEANGATTSKRKDDSGWTPKRRRPDNDPERRIKIAHQQNLAYSFGRWSPLTRSY